ncbi:hypothetical protein ACFLWK_00755, partial [Chloroflexota bacterium]
MAKKNSRGKSGGKSRSGLPLLWLLLLLFAVVALLFWQRSALALWASAVAVSVWGRFGWGLPLIVLAIGTLVVLVWRRKLLSLFRHWNRWLGGVAFALAAWGILAFFPGSGVLRQASLGGSFGQ